MMCCMKEMRVSDSSLVLLSALQQGQQLSGDRILLELSYMTLKMVSKYICVLELILSIYTRENPQSVLIVMHEKNPQ